MKNISIGIILVLVCSCAIFVDKKHRDVESMNAKPFLLPIKLSASFSTHLGMRKAWFDNDDAKEIGTNESCFNHKAGDRRDIYLKSILCKSYIFINNHKQITAFADDKQDRVAFYFQLNERHGVLDTIWTWSNILTAAVLPYRGKRKFNLRVSIIKKNKVVKKYSFSDNFIEWRFLLLLPASPFMGGYNYGTEQVLVNLLSEALNTLKRDNAI